MLFSLRVAHFLDLNVFCFVSFFFGMCELFLFVCVFPCLSCSVLDFAVRSCLTLFWTSFLFLRVVDVLVCVLLFLRFFQFFLCSSCFF